jgi:hypothetical protein
MTPGLELYKPREWLSISALTELARCSRKFFYHSGCRLVTPGAKPALLYGTAIHRALPEVLVNGLDAGLKAFETIWDEDLNDDKRNPARAHALLLAFQQSHLGSRSIYKLLTPPLGALKVASKDSPWEVPFAIDIPGIPIPLVGKIDAMVEHRDTGELWALEWKTTSELGSRFLNNFPFNPQVLCYPLVLSTLTGRPCQGTMVEGLLVAKVSAECLCHPISVPPFQIQDFVAWVRFMYAKLAMCEQLHDFPKEPSGCTSYSCYGSPGYMCDYSDLCHMTDCWLDLRDTVIHNPDPPFILPEELIHVRTT